MKTLFKPLSLGLSLLVCLRAGSVTITLINNETPAYYNGSIGTLLNGTSSAFTELGDPSLDFPDPPDLSPAQVVLGAWLNPSPVLPPQYWTPIPVQVPRKWPVGTETAIVYRIVVPSGGYRNVTMKFGVDNGIFVWLNGQYLGGHMRPGIAILGEHEFAVESLPGGLHHLQVLREDHGSTADYLVEVTAETDPAPVLAEVSVAVEVSWNSAPGGLYQVQRATRLNPSVWHNHGLPVEGDGSRTSVFDRTGDFEYQFYQVLRIR